VQLDRDRQSLAETGSRLPGRLPVGFDERIGFAEVHRSVNLMQEFRRALRAAAAATAAHRRRPAAARA
jgi:hypothetical protein